MYILNTKFLFWVRVQYFKVWGSNTKTAEKIIPDFKALFIYCIKLSFVLSSIS